MGSDVRVLDSHPRDVSVEQVAEQRLVRVALTAVLYSDLKNEKKPILQICLILEFLTDKFCEILEFRGNLQLFR